ncbi:hypothetical protein D9615_009864 [Tricholomella constricta]|uniref:ATP-dependent DNA helicase n=1 Tax=Tricholomella constricta TaxID=117010 RepID=A0A8H5GXJ4_9AGAR|nr:hypothetical protein D9615_009864 [Tricholomella constricta]
MLPPPKEELDEYLAILFTGPCIPTEEDYKRTPVLVRRNFVRTALDWLVLNHPDYADVGISEDNLAEYPETEPLVSVIYRESASIQTFEGSSLHKDEDEDGIKHGDCPFVVHGLTGDSLGAKSTEVLKGLALKHWRSGGKVLRVGHSSEPSSIFKNPALYPQMFPWLFPYGLGGVGSTTLGADTHKKHLLMYHDKCFQSNIAFLFAAFSHHQIAAAATSSYLVAKTAKFSHIAERILTVNQDVLQDIASKLAAGEHFKPVTPDEKECFRLVNDVEHCRAKVCGSNTSKQYMRNEIWSLVANQGAPSWYITLSPADINHPICLYFADTKEKFEPVLREDDERFRLIAKNPVAAARFFHFMVEAFLTHVLGFGTGKAGIYGEASAYYGAVEQQGRLTLHLHVLVWIRNALSPEAVRKAVLDPTSDFQNKLVQYLEAAYQGEFHAPSMDVVAEDVKKAAQDPMYAKPTQTMPVPPPSPCVSKCSACVSCAELSSWWTQFRSTVDDILWYTNVHTCQANMKEDGSVKRNKPYLGCLDNIWKKCKARFPRTVFPQSEVDPATGSLHVRKMVPWLNTFTYAVTYLFRCNTDVTSLRSGTAIKGVLYYVTKYVTKASMKSYVAFEAIRGALSKNTEIIASSDSSKEKARSLMTKLVNSLSAKAEMGSPMMCLYLLKNPDHYTSHKFRDVYWQDFVCEVQKSWPNAKEHGNMPPERVVLFKKNDNVYGMSRVHDYIYRAPELSSLNLYDWVSTCDRLPNGRLGSAKDDDHIIDASDSDDNDDVGCETRRTPFGGGAKNKRPSGSTRHTFMPEHPLASSHCTRCRTGAGQHIPNFMGAALPRFDRGDREYYCTVMMTLFVPWRTGLDLKHADQSWDQAMACQSFLPRHASIIDNFNIQHECFDAQDDFHAQFNRKDVNMPAWTNTENNFLLNSRQHTPVEEFVADTGNPPDDVTISGDLGKYFLNKYAALLNMEESMKDSGWGTPRSELLPRHCSDTSATHVPYQSPSDWKSAVAKARSALLEKRAKHFADTTSAVVSRSNIVDIIDRSFLEKTYKSPTWDAKIQMIVDDFSLNEEQKRAFYIVANHADNPKSEQLKMYIGGMGGTGKSQVLKALIEYFNMRDEDHCFVVVAPTGTAAALLGGSTYHYMFGINTMMNPSAVQLAEIKTRLAGVNYVFFDEVSMLSCRDLHRISARLVSVLGSPSIPFGGMNMIFAGDFAQLPPVKGKEAVSLYSRTAGRKGRSIAEQESGMGKVLWHQVTTVVILRKNMRQVSQSDDDAKLRTALENM